MGIRFECCECHEHFTKKTSLNEHTKKYHPEINMEEIKYEKITVDVEELDKEKTDISKKTCDICGVKFKSLYNLKCHMSSIHEGKRTKCLECGRLLNSFNGFTKHVKNCHKGMGNNFANSEKNIYFIPFCKIADWWTC